MEGSRYRDTDKHGYRYEVEIVSDGIVVFGSTPGLCFDFKRYGIRIRRSKHYDYTLHYAIKNGRLLLCRIETRLSLFHRGAELLGVKATSYRNGRWSVFTFDGVPVEYTGILRVGKGFDARYWKHDEKSAPVPFSPEAYRETGYIRLENGVVTEEVLAST